MKKFLEYYLIVGIVILSVVLFFLFRRISNIENFLASLKNETPIQQVDTCGQDCKKQINDLVSKAVASISGSVNTKTIIQKETVTATSEPGKKTAYIPLSGPITTTSTDWVDAVGTDVYIDLANDYGKNTWVSWEAFLSVTNGNGQAFARLYDITHGIGVNGSEISMTSGTSTQITSGSLSLWAGRNLYRVQLKSLNSFVVTFASGRIKINY